MKTISILLCVLLYALLLLSPALADSGACGPDAVWTLDESGTLTIVGTGAITGPGEWDKETVLHIVLDPRITSIVPDTFRACKHLLTVTGMEGVVSVGEAAFSSCYELQSVDTLKNVITFSDYCFTSCWALADVGSLESARTIGVQAFKDDEALTVLDLSGVTFIDETAFWCCTGLVSVGSLENVTAIGTGAFQGCSSLVRIPSLKSAQTVGVNAFSGCSSLASIGSMQRVQALPSGVFNGCTSLTHIGSLEGLTTLNSGIFSATSLISIRLNGNVVINGNPFKGSPLQKIYCPAGSATEQWAQSKDYATAEFSELVLPPYTTRIEDEAFLGTNVTSYVLGRQVAEIGPRAFANLPQEAEIHITSAHVSIDPTAFQGSNVILFAPSGSDALIFAQQNGLSGYAE